VRGVRVKPPGRTPGGLAILWAADRICKPDRRVCNAAGRLRVPGRPSRRDGQVGCPPMGSSGMKRKGRKRQPKVGTKPERDYALHQSEHAVTANMGVSGKGFLFWGAIVVIVALVFFAVLGLALFF